MSVLKAGVSQPTSQGAPVQQLFYHAPLISCTHLVSQILDGNMKYKLFTWQDRTPAGLRLSEAQVGDPWSHLQCFLYLVPELYTLVGVVWERLAGDEAASARFSQHLAILIHHLTLAQHQDRTPTALHALKDVVVQILCGVGKKIEDTRQRHNE